MWAKVVEILEQDNNIGEALDLQCPRHEDTPLAVTKPEDFLRLSPEGGCDLRCSRRLACGHVCVCKSVTLSPTRPSLLPRALPKTTQSLHPSVSQKMRRLLSSSVLGRCVSGRYSSRRRTPHAGVVLLAAPGPLNSSVPSPC